MQSFDTEPDDALNPSEERNVFSVCSVDAFPQGASLRFTLPNGDELAIYNINGEFYATDNLCPHRGAALTDGAVSGHVVECSLHGWQFDVRTGECLTVPERIKTFEVRVIERVVSVLVR